MSVIRNWRTLLVQASLFWLCFIPPLPLQAAGPPLEIFSEQVDIDLKQQITRFSGKVRILFEPYQAHCQSATVHVDSRSKQVIKIVMKGQVIVSQGQNTIKAEQVSLDVRQNRLQIQGQVYTRFQLERPLNLNLN